jgi:hypothetical protein
MELEVHGSDYTAKLMSRKILFCNAASFPATHEFIASVVDQESMETPSRAIHDRSVVVDSTRRK